MVDLVELDMVDFDAILRGFNNEISRKNNNLDERGHESTEILHANVCCGDREHSFCYIRTALAYIRTCRKNTKQ